MEISTRSRTINDLEFYSGYSCVYSLTGSEIPYVTNVLHNSTIDSNFVLAGGMSGIGAKGSLAYGDIAARTLMNDHLETEMYEKTRDALGTERLIRDLSSRD